LKTVAAYAPLNLFFLPQLLLQAFPLWLWVWLVGGYAIALLTLFIPLLRCFGGGHYYVYYTAVPGVIGWALVLGGTG